MIKRPQTRPPAAGGTDVCTWYHDCAEPAEALLALRDNNIGPLSAVIGSVRDDGDEPALYVRVPRRRAGDAGRTLARAGLVLLVPENHDDPGQRSTFPRAQAAQKVLQFGAA